MCLKSPPRLSYHFWPIIMELPLKARYLSREIKRCPCIKTGGSGKHARTVALCGRDRVTRVKSYTRQRNESAGSIIREFLGRIFTRRSTMGTES